MHLGPRRRLLVAAALAALLLVLFLVRVHRAPEAADEVITHEVHDLIATLQEPLEARDATPWNPEESPGLLWLGSAFLAILGLAGTVWMRRRRPGDQDRPRKSSS